MVIEVDKFLAITAKLAGFVPGAADPEAGAGEGDERGPGEAPADDRA